jgi:collagenase-like PrtC family protease
MRYYSVPADFRKGTIDKYEGLNKNDGNSRVIETYGNITKGKFLGSGRLVRQMGKVDLLDLYEYIKYSKEKNIDFNYTLNPTHMQNREFSRQGSREITNFLSQIHEAGVRSLTITLPSLMELVQSTKLDFRIRISCLCQVRNANRALAYKKMGVDRIVVDESVNRNFYALKSIREVFGKNVEVIVNQICDRNCMYRLFHYNMISGDPFGTTSEVSINYYEHRCVLQQLKSIDNSLKLCWVRPEDIKYYTAVGIDYFKIQGRHAFVQGGDVVKTVESYFNESYEGNLMDLLMMFGRLTNFKVYLDNKKLEGFIKPFVENPGFCKDNCSKCKYCENFARKCLDIEQVENMQNMAKEFYNMYDQYKELLAQTRPGRELNPEQDNTAVDFDL